MTYKVVYNACFGGFSLSGAAVRRAKELAPDDKRWQEVCEQYGYSDMEDIPRHDPVLVQVVEEMGDDASGSCARLRVKEIESNHYRISEYDGNESVETQSTVNWTVII